MIGSSPTIQELIAGTPKPQAMSVRLSDVAITPVLWLWPGRIPLGKLTILDGDPGLGKSSVTLDLAARLTRGLPMPCTDPASALPPSNVLLLTAEDGLGDTIRPRIEAAGADASHIIALSAITCGEDRKRPVFLPDDIGYVRAKLVEADARLVLIDPLMAYLPEHVNTYSDQSARRALLPLSMLAEDTGAAFLVVRHLNKQSGRNALYRGGGSIGIIGAARSGLIVCKDQENPNIRYLGATKSNLCKTPRTLRFELVDAGGCPRVHWLDEADVDIESLLNRSEPGESCNHAVAFLMTALRAGPRSAGDLKREAEAAGISERTLQRAKAMLGVVSNQIGTPNGGHEWQWSLPNTDVPAA